MAESWQPRLGDSLVGDLDESDQEIEPMSSDWQHHTANISFDCSSIAQTPPWRGRLAQRPERAPWSSQLGDDDSLDGTANEAFPDLTNDISELALSYRSGQSTARPSPRQSISRELLFNGHASGESTARPSRRQSLSQELMPSSTARRLGLGWPSSYYPPVARPWHDQHPSIVDNHYLLSTCDNLKSIFPESARSFVPENTPWFSHWMIAFWAQKTTLTEVECCMVYRYKYRDAIPGIQHMKAKHVVELWDCLRDGEREYAFHWERTEGFESSLRSLLDVWLSESCRPQRWEREEKRFRYHAVLNGADI